MNKTGPDRQYTEEFRHGAISQVIEGGRSLARVAQALEVPKGTLGNWVAPARSGEPAIRRMPARLVTELEAEVTRLHAENSRLKLEKEILKKARLLNAYSRPSSLPPTVGNARYFAHINQRQNPLNASRTATPSVSRHNSAACGAS